MNLFIITISIITMTIPIGLLTISIHTQSPTTSDLPLNTINETDSTVNVLNKTLPPENATGVVSMGPK
jgi:hypothetical protein